VTGPAHLLLAWRQRASAARAAAGRAGGNVVTVISDRLATGSAAATTPRPQRSDYVLAAVVIAIQLALTGASSAWGGHPGTSIRDYLILAAGGAALVFRRRYPVAVLAAAFAATFLVKSTSHSGAVWVVLIVAFFNAVVTRRRAAAIAALAAGYLAAVWPPWLVGSSGGKSMSFALWLAAWLLILLGTAELIRLRVARSRALAHGREQEMRRRASEERMRIARDLHDVLAHNISLINVQANTALHLRERQPERAWTALATINEVSKQALVELRSVLGVLRQVDEGEPRSPVPGLARVDELVTQAHAAGLTVKLDVTGERRPLPANIDLAAYRIVQEALTNSAKHAAGSQVAVNIAYGDDDVAVQIEDAGGTRVARPDRAAVLAAGGNGLAGMNERVNALYGRLIVGPRPEGGFRVHAWLPLNGASQ
jgi:signal transduction histidine kinase